MNFSSIPETQTAFGIEKGRTNVPNPKQNFSTDGTGTTQTGEVRLAHDSKTGGKTKFGGSQQIQGDIQRAFKKKRSHEDGKKEANAGKDNNSVAVPKSCSQESDSVRGYWDWGQECLQTSLQKTKKALNSGGKGKRNEAD